MRGMVEGEPDPVQVIALRPMLIVKAHPPPLPVSDRLHAHPAAAGPGGEAMFDLIELLFFAYRDFVSDADRLLETYGFGRAHHRVLHFVDRHPGLTVAELLDILRITKQSLNRVMKDLLDGGFVAAEAGVDDRRRRMLRPTDTGRALAIALADLQSARFRRTLASLPGDARDNAVTFLLGMIDDAERAKVVDLVWGGHGGRPPGVGA